MKNIKSEVEKTHLEGRPSSIEFKKKKAFPLRSLLILVLILLNFGCDQASKKIARSQLDYYEKIEVLGNFFYLTKVENTGAMLSFGSRFSPFWRSLLLTYIPLIVLAAGVVYVLVRRDWTPWEIGGYSFILGGGIGNLLDRVFYGSVTDFMNMGIMNLRTGIFNMADVSIMVGLGALILGAGLKKKKPESAPPPESDPS